MAYGKRVEIPVGIKLDNVRNSLEEMRRLVDTGLKPNTKEWKGLNSILTNMEGKMKQLEVQAKGTFTSPNQIEQFTRKIHEMGANTALLSDKFSELSMDTFNIDTSKLDKLNQELAEMKAKMADLASDKIGNIFDNATVGGLARRLNISLNQNVTFDGLRDGFNNAADMMRNRIATLRQELGDLQINRRGLQSFDANDFRAQVGQSWTNASTSKTTLNSKDVTKRFLNDFISNPQIGMLESEFTHTESLDKAVNIDQFREGLRQSLINSANATINQLNVLFERNGRLNDSQQAKMDSMRRILAQAGDRTNGNLIDSITEQQMGGFRTNTTVNFNRIAQEAQQYMQAHGITATNRDMEVRLGETIDQYEDRIIQMIQDRLAENGQDITDTVQAIRQNRRDITEAEAAAVHVEDAKTGRHRAAENMRGAVDRKEGQVKAAEIERIEQYNAAKENLITTSQREGQAIDIVKGKTEQLSETYGENAKEAEKMSHVQGAIKGFLGFQQVLNYTRSAVRNAISSIRELDKVMTEIAVVTNMTQKELWGQIDTYTALAKQYGVETKGVYEISMLYYQQGLNTRDAMAATTETLKMAKIAGLDYATATDYMTNAIRGFKMEMTDAQRITDVYSALAASTASSTEELAVAMSKTASSAESVGASFEATSAMIATMVSVTRESATNIGSALKSIISRYGEMTSNPEKLIDDEGEELSLNKVDKALQSVGISIHDASGQFRNFDDVIYELAQKWDTLDSLSQRYIGTVMAGNRQQSRFLALVGNFDQYAEALKTAQDSEDAGALQTLKTLDGIEAKLNQLKMTWQEFYSNTGIESLIKIFVDGLTSVLERLNGLPKFFGKIPGVAVGVILSIVQGFKNLALQIVSSWQVSLDQLKTATIKKTEETNQELLKKNKEKNDKINQQNQEAREQDANNAKNQNNQNNNSSNSGSSSGILNKFTTGKLKGASAALSGLGAALQMVGLAAGNTNPKLGALAQGFGAVANAAGMAAMATGPAGWIMAGLTAIVGVASAISSVYESAEEKLQRLKKTAQDAKNEMLQSKSEYKSLDSAVKKLEELSKKRYESSESYKEWIDYNAEILEQYPDLVGYIDSEGQGIIDLAAAYDLLSEAKENYIAKSDKQVIAEEDAVFTELNNIKTEAQKNGFFNLDKDSYNPLEGVGMVGQYAADDVLRAMFESPVITSANIDNPFIAAFKRMPVNDYNNGEISDFEQAIKESYGVTSLEDFNIQQLGELRNDLQAIVTYVQQMDPNLQDYKNLTLVQDLQTLLEQIDQERVLKSRYNSAEKSVLNTQKGNLRNKITENFLDGSLDSNLESYTEILLRMFSDDALMQKDLFKNGDYKDTLFSSATKMLDWLSQQSQDFTETYFNNIQMMSFNDFIEKAGIDKNADEDLYNAFLNYWLDINGYQEDYFELNEERLAAFSGQMEGLISREGQLKNSSSLRDQNEGQALSNVLEYVAGLDTAEQQAVDAILGSGDLQSIVGIIDVMHELADKGLRTPELEERLNNLRNTLNINLSLEYENLASSMEQKVEDFEKDLSAAAKGLSFKDANSWVRKLGDDAVFEDLFYEFNGNYFFKDSGDSIQQYYNRKFEDYRTAIVEVQEAILNEALDTANFKDKDTLRDSNFGQKYSTLVDDFISQGGEVTLEAFVAWIESLDDNEERVREYYEDLARRTENESWAATKDAQYEMSTLALDFLKSASGVTAKELAELYNKTEAQIDDQFIAEQGWFKLAGSNEYAMTYANMMAMAEVAGEEQRAEVQDLLRETLKTMLETISKGINGGMSTVDYENLIKQYSGLSVLDTYEDNNGVHFATTSLAHLYDIIKKTNPEAEQLQEILDKLYDGASLADNIRELAKINKLERELTEQEKYRKQTLEDIIKLRSKEKDSFSFMSTDKGQMNNPAEYWKNLGSAMKAINESKSTGQMDWEEWVDIWQHIGDTIGDTAIDVNGKSFTAAQLLEDGLGALTDVDGNIVVDMSKTALGILGSTDEMSKGMDVALKTMAEKQIEMLDAQINMLEGFAALEDLDVESSTADIVKAFSEFGDLNEEYDGGWLTFVNSLTDTGKLEAFLKQVSQIWDHYGEDSESAYQAILELMNNYDDNIQSLTLDGKTIQVGGIEFEIDENGNLIWPDSLNSESAQVLDLNTEVTNLGTTAELATTALREFNEEMAKTANGGKEPNTPSSGSDEGQGPIAETWNGHLAAKKRYGESQKELHQQQQQALDWVKALEEFDKEQEDALAKSLDDPGNTKQTVEDFWQKRKEAAEVTSKLYPKAVIQETDVTKAIEEGIEALNKNNPLIQSQTPNDAAEVFGPFQETLDTTTPEIDQLGTSFITLNDKTYDLNNLTEEEAEELDKLAIQTGLMTSGFYKVEVGAENSGNELATFNWALNNTAQALQQFANAMPHLPVSTGGPTQAKGTNIASGAAKAQGTLMGELGPELFVTDGHYYVAGQNGAEFVNLPDDAIVFNHLQTKHLLNNGNAGRGTPVTNERTAISYAKGNIAMASAKDTIQELKNVRKMWETIASMSAQDFGKKAGSGGGGGGSISKSQLHDLERWYNLLRQIESAEKHITLEQAKRANMRNGHDMVKSMRNELSILKDQRSAYGELASLQKSYYDARRQDLEASEYGKIFTYTEHGLQQYVDGENRGLDILAKLNETDVNGTPINNAKDSKAQLEYLKSVGFDVEKLKINADGTKAEDADTQMQNFWTAVDDWKEEMDGLYDSYHDAAVSFEKNAEEQRKLLKELVDNQLEVEDKLLNAIEERQQKAIDDLQDEHDKFSDANQKYIDGLNKALDREKQMYEDSENDKDLAQLQRRLAILMRSGGSAADIKSLQDEIDGKLKDSYFDQMQKQIDAVQEASDNQLEKLQTQIDIMTEQLAFQKENGLLWEEVYEMMNNWSEEEMLDFIQNNVSSYLSDSATKNDQNAQETLQQLQIWKETLATDFSDIEQHLEDGIIIRETPAHTPDTSGTASSGSSGSGSSGSSSGSGSGSGGNSSSSSKTSSSANNAANTQAIKDLQMALGRAGYYKGTVDGIYGSGTKAAVKYLQQVLNTTADGLYGKETATKAKRYLPALTWPAGIYAAGGINTVTGPAWLDGTPQKPEAVFNADDYKLLKSSIFSDSKYSLKSAITSVNDLVNNLAHSNDSIANESVTIENVAINLDSGVIGSDYDARRAGKTIKEELLAIARKTGNLTK